MAQHSLRVMVAKSAMPGNQNQTTTSLQKPISEITDRRQNILSSPPFPLLSPLHQFTKTAQSSLSAPSTTPVHQHTHYQDTSTVTTSIHIVVHNGTASPILTCVVAPVGQLTIHFGAAARRRLAGAFPVQITRLSD